MKHTQENAEAPSETRADSARVGAGYETLDSYATKAAYEELNSVLDSLANQVVYTIDQIIPQLAEMQSLLSQRGKARKKVLKVAGVPSWTDYGKAYADRLECSFRKIQDHITRFNRNGKSGRSKSPKNGPKSSPTRLDRRQQATLVKAQLAANELVSALKSGGDWPAAVTAYEQVAVTPPKLDSYLNSLKLEPDWKSVLTELMSDLEQAGDRLPLSVISRMRTVQKMLGETPQRGVSSIEVDTPPTNRFNVEPRGDGQYAVVNASTQKVWQTYPTEVEADNAAESLNKPVVILPIHAQEVAAQGATGLDCTGCREMHEGIVQLAQEHTNWSDEQLAAASGCSPAIVRQAKARFLAWKEVA